MFHNLCYLYPYFCPGIFLSSYVYVYASYLCVCVCMCMWVLVCSTVQFPRRQPDSFSRVARAQLWFISQHFSMLLIFLPSADAEGWCIYIQALMIFMSMFPFSSTNPFLSIFFYCLFVCLHGVDSFISVCDYCQLCPVTETGVRITTACS